MIRRKSIVCATTAVAVLLAAVLCYEPASPKRSLVFSVLPMIAQDSNPPACMVIVSNISDCTVEYTEGLLKKPWFEIASRSNSVWQHYQISRPHSSPALLRPHETRKNVIPVPAGAIEIKVGMDITSLTWKGRLAYRLFRSDIGQPVRGLIPLLLSQDRNNRSRIEWSDAFSVASGSVLKVE